MEEFAHRENIRRFENELRSEPDPAKRRLIEALLAEERKGLERVIREKNGGSSPKR